MSIFDITNWRLIDQSTLAMNIHPLQSFAIDDTLCDSVGEKKSAPTIRTWVHERTVVLGIQDSRLPYIEKGIQCLTEQTYHVIVRNSGGLAVVLDEGILNISLIMKENRQISINSGYEAMLELVQAMFKDETSHIKAGEIIGSYCPGSFDLSIDGKKFAGISQRRVRGGVAVQIYLCVNNSGSERAALIKQFYDLAVSGEKTKFPYPVIVPETMASLEELLQIKLSISNVMSRLLHTINRDGATEITPSQLTFDEYPLYESNYEKIKNRQLQF